MTRRAGILPRKPSACIAMLSLKRPTAPNFTVKMPAMSISAIVQKMAMPPPRGMIESWNLSSAGLATKSVLRERFLTMAVRITESRNEPAKSNIANIVIV